MNGEELPPLPPSPPTLWDSASTPEGTSVSDRAYFAARDGLDTTLNVLLAEQAKPERDSILSALTVDHGQSTTPLIIAAKNGHERVVHKLLSKWKPNVTQTGNVKFGSYVIEGASALWCAAGAGHLKIVKLLVKSGADIDQATKMRSTPLRAACFDGRLDIVQYLVDNGADMTITNIFRNSCLMIAAYNAHVSVVSYLLEKGCDPNLAANCGATALHFSAECGNLPVVRVLVAAGAVLTMNQSQLTPLMAAAERCQDDVVLFLLDAFSAKLQKEEVVAAHELLGASFANDKDKGNLGLSKVYLELGMKKRLEEPVLPKGEVPIIEAYNSVAEPNSVDELNLAFQDDSTVHMMCLALRERILGRANPELPHHIVFRGAVHADVARFDRCLALWMHALQLRRETGVGLKKDLLRFAQVFCQMVHLGVPVEPTGYLEVLRSTNESIVSDVDKSNRPEELKLKPEDLEAALSAIEFNMHTFLYFVALFPLVKQTMSEEQQFDAMQLFFHVIKTNPIQRDGTTLLHMACNSDTQVDDFHTNDVVRFPSAACVTLLLEAGAAPDAMNAKRNTPLHLIVGYERCVQDFITLHTVIMALLEAGAHDDIVNQDGRTPLETAATGVAEIFLKSVQRVSLKCLAANTIGKHRVTYQGKIPDALAKFVRLHIP